MLDRYGVLSPHSYWARMALLLCFAVAAPPALADAFPDTIYFDGFEACGLQCARVQCPGNGTTSLSGTIFAPEGTIALPNVEVYIANATVGALVDGPPMLRCDQSPSGHPLVATLTGSDGKFTLTNVPAGVPMNLVVLAGKWRRQVPVPALTACVNTPLDPATTRLPRNHSEGDIAHLAVVTGGSDSLECLVRKSGVADSELTTSSGSGRVHLFAGLNGVNHFDAANGGATFADATLLWASASTLSAYDQVMFGCEGSQNIAAKPQTALAALKAYADSGGRVYLAHWQNYWIQAGSMPWNTLATWNNSLSNLDSFTADVNDTFAQAAVLRSWLSFVGASAIDGKLAIFGGRQTAVGIDNAVARKWIYLDTTVNDAASMQYFTFTTPAEATPDLQQGRILFTDMHSSPADPTGSTLAFPSTKCTSSTLTPQDFALLYATFDLQRCVGSTRE